MPVQSRKGIITGTTEPRVRVLLFSKILCITLKAVNISMWHREQACAKREIADFREMAPTLFREGGGYFPFPKVGGPPHPKNGRTLPPEKVKISSTQPKKSKNGNIWGKQ